MGLWLTLNFYISVGFNSFDIGLGNGLRNKFDNSACRE